jgi:ribonucleoside-diphosphate reductase alpha chain
MWENRDNYTGISVLPHDDNEHTYVQAPFQEISKEEYEEMVKHLHKIDLTKVVEIDDQTDLSGELACAGGACTI